MDEYDESIKPDLPPKKSFKIRGTLKRKDGEIYIRADLGKNFTGWATGQVVDIPMEEVFEDFDDDESVYVRVLSEPTGKALYENIDWNDDTFKTVHPDYKYASKEAYEKFLDMKFGMMIHWGIYSHLGIPESWPANRERCDPEFLDVYYTLWQMFNPVLFNADEWAELAVSAGMQFFQFTTKHHDGFCMYDTKTKTWARKRVSDQGGGIGGVTDVYINFSIMDTPFKRDIVKELVEAFRKRNLGIGFYFSHIDWNDPNFRWDRANRSFDPNYGPETHPEEWKMFIKRERDQLREIMSNYGPIDQIFFDGTWFGLENEEMVKNILMCRELQPDCMFSDRGIGPYGDFTSPERWIPDSPDDKRLKGRKVFQVCDPIHSSWAYLPDDRYKSRRELLHNLVDAIAKGGTYVFAISPMPTGVFPEKTVKILEFMGDWLKKYGEAIYATRPWKKFKEDDKDIYFTRSKDNSKLYIIPFEKPNDPDKPQLIITGIKPANENAVTLLGGDKSLKWTEVEGTLRIDLPENIPNLMEHEYAYAIRVEL